VPDRAVRRRGVPPVAWELLRHRVAVPVARAYLRLPRGRAPARAVPKVTILLVHAWGMGGTIRTMLNVAGWLARSNEVEVLSVWRTREKPFFAFPPGVVVTAADDRRPGALPTRAARLLRRMPGWLLFPGDYTSRRMTLWSDAQLLRRLRASRPDVLIGTRPALNLLVAGAGGAPALVASEHTPFWVYREWLQRELWRRYGTLDAVVVLGEAQRAPLEEVVRGAAQVCVIPNAVPQQRGGAARLERPVVVAAGRLVPAKAFGRLIRAFTWVAEEHPGWRLRICGGGPQRDELAALIDELRLGEHVQLAGKVRDMEAELEAASVFALSSRVEGLPIALLEAMAKGLAVVSFDTAACGVVEHGVNGLLAPDGDEQALARAICGLIESPALRRRLGAAARDAAAAYGIESVGARWDALIARLTGVTELPPRSDDRARERGEPRRHDELQDGR
jgi:glycosyltransferase involved in cell wall biosynthesis